MTDPERYRPLHAVASRVLDDLEARYVVVRTEGADLDAHLSSLWPASPMVRLTPADGGAPLTVALTDLPGVLLRAGHAWGGGFPHCGCDACGEGPAELADELHAEVAAIVAGGLSETRTRRHLRRDRFRQRLRLPDGERSTWGDVERGEPPEDIPTGRTDWARWSPGPIERARRPGDGPLLPRSSASAGPRDGPAADVTPQEYVRLTPSPVWASPTAGGRPMPHVTSHAHGVPSYTDLATPDPAAAKDFYGALFGWEFDDQPAGPDMTYTMCLKDGDVAAGMMELSPEMAQAGMPPVWSSYITVDDLDEATGRVEPAGGQVMRPPMDVMDAGRMAVVTDSTGAVICLWETKESIGAEVINEHGALTWNELLTPDPSKAAGFYADVAGWTAQTVPMPMGDYTVFFVEGGHENGIAGSVTPPMDMPPAWLVYFHVDDCDATAALATDKGATVMGEPMDIPGVGRIAPIVDPHGATFAVMTPESGQ